jgi:nickel transport system permease protein
LSREKVAPQIENAIQKSTPLALLAGAIGAMIALSIALFFEKGVVPFAQLSASIPLFWAAPVALLFFSRHRLTWSFAQGTWAPSLLLGIWLASQWVRICSEEYRKGVRSPHYKSAQGRGVSGISLKMIYGFLPQSSTVLQIFFMQMGNLISGTLIIEATFSRPGLGTYLIDALQKRDWPCFDAALLTTGLICIGSNILSEGVRQWIDPRLSRSSST